MWKTREVQDCEEVFSSSRSVDTASKQGVAINHRGRDTLDHLGKQSPQKLKIYGHNGHTNSCRDLIIAFQVCDCLLPLETPYLVH